MTLEQQIAEREKQYKDSTLFKKMYEFIKPEIWRFVLGIVIDMITVVIFSFEPRISGMIINYVDQGNSSMCLLYSFIFLGAVIAALVCMYFANMTLQKVGQNVIYSVRVKLFDHIEHFSINQLNSLPVGKLVARVTSDTSKIMNLFIEIIPNFIRAFTSLVAVFIQVMVDSWEVGLTLLAFIPLIAIFIVVFRKISRKVYRDARASVSDLNGFLSENISGMVTTKIFNQEERKLKEFDEKNNFVKKSHLRQVRFFGIFRPLFYFLYVLSVIAVIFVGTYLTMKRGITNGGLLFSFYLYAGQFSNPITNLAQQFDRFQEALTAIERVSIINDIPPEVLDIPEAKDVPSINGKIEFKNVWFAYVGEEWVLKDVSFVIEKGETAAFVGATGAGKSTIISLITRNYECQKGEILIDDVPIKMYTLNTLREHIGAMLQDVFLFSGSIAENISLFDDSHSKDEIIQAAKYVGADHFIEQLPNTYDEIVKERGNNFSMGQRQLISFARVVLYHPNIILLDEATANIDTETEVLIQNSLEKMSSIGTMVIVAHRLSTIKHADKIFVISAGKIIESGNHQSLLRKRGTYYNLYRLQNMEREVEK